MSSLKICLDEELCAAGLEHWLDLDCIYKDGQRILIVGPSGSGKTVFATSLLGKISLHMHEPLICLVDPKGLDFRFCEGCVNYYAVDNALAGIERFFSFFEERLKGRAPLDQPAILFIDELSSLILSLPKKEAEGLKNKIARILNLSRALNISVIIALQRADAVLFDNGSRENFNIRFIMGNAGLNREGINMIASEYKDFIKPCPTGIGYMITDKGIKKIRSVMPRNTEKLHNVLREAVNRSPQGGAEQ